MYQCIYVCVYMYECIHVWVYKCMSVYMYECIHIWVYICMSVDMYGCIHVWVYTCMSVYMYECINILYKNYSLVLSFKAVEIPCSSFDDFISTLPSFLKQQLTCTVWWYSKRQASIWLTHSTQFICGCISFFTRVSIWLQIR